MKFWAAFSFIWVIYSGTYGQMEFVFPELDHLYIELWDSNNNEAYRANDLLINLKHEWSVVKEKINKMSLSHFAARSFIEEQDGAILKMENLLSSKNYKGINELAYSQLIRFKEIRNCFTNDEYTLDYLLDAYEYYLPVHNIIHDKMMNLQEWNEFIWQVDQLKRKVQLLDIKLFYVDSPVSHANISSSFQRLRECLGRLENSLKSAYRPDFELPCDEMGDALMEVIRTTSSNKSTVKSM